MSYQTKLRMIQNRDGGLFGLCLIHARKPDLRRIIFQYDKVVDTIYTG
jgi:hypothetical protein